MMLIRIKQQLIEDGWMGGCNKIRCTKGNPLPPFTSVMSDLLSLKDLFECAGSFVVKYSWTVQTEK